MENHTERMRCSACLLRTRHVIRPCVLRCSISLSNTWRWPITRTGNATAARRTVATMAKAHDCTISPATANGRRWLREALRSRLITGKGAVHAFASHLVGHLPRYSKSGRDEIERGAWGARRRATGATPVEPPGTMTGQGQWKIRRPRTPAAPGPWPGQKNFKPAPCPHSCPHGSRASPGSCDLIPSSKIVARRLDHAISAFARANSPNPHAICGHGADTEGRLPR
jgi:hypothetical protein